MRIVIDYPKMPYKGGGIGFGGGEGKEFPDQSG
jgi:hypothetical protein